MEEDRQSRDDRDEARVQPGEIADTEADERPLPRRIDGREQATDGIGEHQRGGHFREDQEGVRRQRHARHQDRGEY